MGQTVFQCTMQLMELNEQAEPLVEELKKKNEKPNIIAPK
jgi:hypothetical protein